MVTIEINEKSFNSKLLLKQLKEKQVKHKNGFTIYINERGLMKHYKPTSKNLFVVSTSNRVNTSIKQDEKFLLNQLKKTLSNSSDILIGYWKDQTNNKHLDSARIVKGKLRALRLAKEFKQKAIFNFNTFTSLNVKQEMNKIPCLT